MVRKLFATLLLTAACSAAHADQPLVGPQPPPGTAIAIGIAPAKIRAPYDVQVIREGGETLPTYAMKDRFYVQGNVGERYIIRVTNPTPNRVEAVVTVDGLDVIDGESGDLRKRGYVVPPYGDVRIEGFRTSQADVATFRFSAVDNSYAGMKGKARNVGVIAVAIFEEQAPEPEQQIIVGESGGGYRPPYDYEDDLDGRASAGDGWGGRGGAKADAKAAPKKSAPARESVAVRDRRPAAPTTSATGGAAVRPSPPPPPHRIDADKDMGAADEEMAPPPTGQRTNRPGLGTEFGESRYSAASFTKFVRAAQRPIAIAELRYNDAAGLIALGIHAQPLPDEGEIMTRETADPFPGDHNYARPPR
ncbi:MAG TPA: hypothetical protein VFQ53_34155 [Kofleriaceae bacterium]|nr:hypothetical protein [Kofleriaceae bacterium]